MNLSVVIDWRFFAVLGAATVGTILVLKMDAAAAERVSTHLVDACKEREIAVKSED